MRFKKIVFGLILSLMLAFPAYASEIIPISVDNAGVNSIIQPRGSHQWSGDGYPFPPYQYTTSAPQTSGINGNVTFTLNPGETIRINASYGRQSSFISLRSSGGLPYKYAQDYYHSNTSTSHVAGHAWFVTMDNTAGDKVVQLFMPAHEEGSESEGYIRVPDTYYNVTLRPAHTHSWSLSQGDSGYHWQVCSCGHSQNKAPHQWQFVSNSATCINPGVETTRCTVCGRTETETSQPLGHDKVFVRESEATCTEPAKKYYSCSRCHLTIIDEIGDPLGHDFQPKWYPVGQWQDVYWQDTCTRCGLVQGDRHYKEVPVNFITIDYHTKEELQRVTKLVTFDSIVRGDSLGTKNETFNGVEYRYHGATGLDNQLFARPDLDVYRYMVKHKYTIYFNPNGGEGEMTPITLTYGSRVTLPANTFTRTGYNFIGWSKTPTGSADYPDKYWSENDLRSQAEAGERCDLYAIWEGKTVVVSFENGVGETPTPIRVTYDQPYGKLPTPTMDTGFRFKGWKYTEINNDTDEVIRQFSVTPDTIVTVADDHVLTADYAESAIKITFVAPSKVQVIDAISGYTVSPPFVPNEEGKNFIHWSLSEGGEAFDFNTPIEEDTTFYAVFESKQVTCTLVDYGVKKYYYPAKIGELPVPEQPGQRFVGWFWDEACKQPVSATESIPLNDFSLYPKFTEGNYILSLNTSAQKWEMK